MKKTSLEKIIFKILENKKYTFYVFFIFLSLFILSISMFPTKLIKAKMLPSKNSDTFSIYVDLKDGSSKYETKEVTNCIVKNLQFNKNITSISVYLNEGQALDFAGMVKGSALKDQENQAEITVNLKKEKNRNISSYNLVSKIRPIIQKACQKKESSIKFIELPAGPPVLASIVAEIYGGDNIKSRKNFAIKIKHILEKQKTLVDIDVLASDDFYMYSIILNTNKIISSKVDLQQIKGLLFLAFEGMHISSLNEKDSPRQVKLYLRLDNKREFENANKEEIKNRLSNLKIMNKDGQMLNFSEFISIKKVLKDPVISSKNLKKYINVIAETSKDSQIYPLLASRDMMLKDLARDYEVKKTNMLNLEFIDKKTKEVFILIWDGELKVTIDTFIDLGAAFILALVLIFFLMVIYYKSFYLSYTIVISSFISIIGVIFAHVLADLLTTDTFYLTATSLIGFIGLIGINSRNSTLIIDFTKQLLEQPNMSVNEAISKSCATRSKPIILTVLTMVFASSLLASDAVFGGLGIALIGGTLISYIVSMFFVPLLLKTHFDKEQNKSKIL